MKRNFYLFFLFFLSFCFSQTYQFDTITKYVSKNTSNNYSSDVVNYFNTSDFTYTLSLAKSETRFVALLFDRGRNLIHYFTVLENRDNGDIQFQFKYDYSLKKQANKSKVFFYEFSQPSEISPNEVTLKIFRNKKSKKPIAEQQLTLQNSERNLFPAYQEAFLAHYPSHQVFPGDFIVSKVIEKCSNCSCEVTLAEQKKVNLKINLPSTLNLISSKFNNL